MASARNVAVNLATAIEQVEREMIVADVGAYAQQYF
jgi:hypothetical protein